MVKLIAVMAFSLATSKNCVASFVPYMAVQNCIPALALVVLRYFDNNRATRLTVNCARLMS